MWKENCKIAYKFKSTNEWLVVPKDGYTVDGKKVAVVSDGFELKCDHNPYHDKKGRFTSKGNTSDGLSILSTVKDSYGGEAFMVMSAMDGNKVAGTIEYSVFEDVPAIQMIEVAEGYKRKGVATKMLQALQREYKDTEIQFGYTTEDGEKLLKAISYEVPNKAVINYNKKLKRLETELDGYQKTLDDVWNKVEENPSYEFTDKDRSIIETVGDKWNETSDAIHALKRNRILGNETKTLIKLDSPTSDLATKHGANWKTINGAKVLVGKGGTIIAGMGGKFNKVPTSGGWVKQCAEEKARVLALKPNRQALYVLDNDGQTDEVCLEAMNSGKTEELVEDYFNKLEANGDPTPTKETAGQYYARPDIESGKYKNYVDARKGHISKITGQTEAEAELTLRELDNWTGGSGYRADQKVLDRFVEKAPAYNGKIHRGMSFREEADYEAFMKDVGDGKVIKMKGCASWSDNQTVARRFGHAGDDYLNSVMITCVKNRTSAPIDFANQEMEGEVLSHSKASWTVLHHEVYTTRAGAKKAYLTVIEKGEYEK